MAFDVVVAFKLLVYAHIAVGVVGLVSFWVPVIGRKGGPAHKRFGRIFTRSMLCVGAIAIGISTCTLIAPAATHPHIDASVELVRGVFGWMMIYLAVLTVNLAWYGWLCVKNRNDREASREWRNLALQALLLVAAVNCGVRGVLIGMPLMIAISMVGLATVATNLWFLYGPEPGPRDWLKEHIKALVGAGISVYTAFLAFGAVRLMPEIALHPALWAVPLTVGLSLIFYHRREVDRRTQARRPARAGA